MELIKISNISPSDRFTLLATTEILSFDDLSNKSFISSGLSSHLHPLK